MTRTPLSLFLLSLLLAVSSPLLAQQTTVMYPYQNTSLPVEQRVNDLLGRLTTEEKISLLSGTGFETKPIPRLGIPPLNMTDGPVGVRWGKSTAFPVSIAMAATWNTALIERLGKALGQETKAKGRRMLLGPCVNIQRTPFAGRNFESFGEDPFLAARMAATYVQGVQSERVIATTKHFACNNQEYQRDFIDTKVDERTLREIYLPAFEAAVKEGGSWSVMSAYNKVNGAWCSENPHLLSEILKKEWGFKGFVVSDWGAVHSIVPTANAGLDVEMPTGVYLNEQLLAAVGRGEVKESIIDDKLRRLFAAIFWTGIFDSVATSDTGSAGSAEHRQLARETAAEGIVLLKNNGNLLPLNHARVKSIAVIGPNAAIARTGGGGSSMVSPLDAVAPLDGLKERAGAITIRYAAGVTMEGDVPPIPASALRTSEAVDAAQGLKGEYFDNMTLSGKPILTRVDTTINFDWDIGAPASDLPVDTFSVRWTGKLIASRSGKYTLTTVNDDGVRLYIDGQLVIDDWKQHSIRTSSVTVILEGGKAHDIRLEYFESRIGAVVKLGWEEVSGARIAEAVEAARTSDVALVFVGLSNKFESEGFDRKTLDLPEGQSDLIAAVAKANKRTVVILNSGAPVSMEPWLTAVPAVVEAWYPGGEGGRAIADILFGEVNPSGKLPITFLQKWEDSPAYGNYPGKDSAVSYAEGIFVGYRHYDKAGIRPVFPFGHGLSYTTFTYSNLAVRPVAEGTSPQVEVSLDVRNSGRRAGAEVVQVYVQERAPNIVRPVKELKGFAKVFLQPGESKRVTVMLDDRSFAFYDVNRKSWMVDPGTYLVQVGSSSRDIRATNAVDIQ